MANRANSNGLRKQGPKGIGTMLLEAPVLMACVISGTVLLGAGMLILG